MATRRPFWTSSLRTATGAWPKAILYGGDREGREAIKVRYKQLAELCPEHWELRELIDRGDDVIALSFERLRVKSAGQAFEQRIAIVYALREGKISAVRLFEAAPRLQRHL